MKAIVALSIFFAIAIARDVCLPDEFIVDEVTFDHQKNDAFGIRVFYNKKLQAERIDVDFIEEGSQVLSERISIIADYNSGQHYTVVYNLTTQTANCTVRSIQGNLRHPCLARNAEHKGSIVLGGVLHCDNYVESFKQGSVKADVLLVKNTNIPIRSFDYSQDNSAFTEYWNFEEKAPEHHFYPPHVCDNAEEDSFDVFSLHKLAKYSPLLNKH